MVVLRYRAIVKPRRQKWSISIPRFPNVIRTVSTFSNVIKQAEDALLGVVKAMQQDRLVLPPDLGEEEPEQEIDLSRYRDPRLVVISVRVRSIPLIIKRRTG